MIFVAEWAVRLLLIYAAIGVVFAVAFSARGVERVDPAAEGGTWGFRVLIVPGSAALWPWLLRRWLKGQPLPTESNAHRAAAERE